MKQQATETLQSFAVVVIAGAMCWAASAINPGQYRPHAYHANTTGAVAWQCGPGIDAGVAHWDRGPKFTQAPGLFWEGDC